MWVDTAKKVGELNGFPFTAGVAQIYRVEPDGTTTSFATGFTQVSALAFGGDGSLYVLEYDSNGLLASGDSGALIRLDAQGNRETIFSDGLINPTGLAMGADGAFYVANHGNSAGDSEVLRIAAVPEPEQYVLLGAGLLAVGFAVRGRQRRAG